MSGRQSRRAPPRDAGATTRALDDALLDVQDAAIAVYRLIERA